MSTEIRNMHGQATCINCGDIDCKIWDIPGKGRIIRCRICGQIQEIDSTGKSRLLTLDERQDVLKKLDEAGIRIEFRG